MKRCSLVLVIKGKMSGPRKVPVLQSDILGLWPAPKSAGPRLQCRNQCLDNCKQWRVFSFQGHAVMSTLKWWRYRHVIGNVDQVVRKMSSYMQFDSHHNPLWHASLPCHSEMVHLKEDKRKKINTSIKSKKLPILSYPPLEISIQRVMMPLKSNACMHFVSARWLNPN